MAMTLEEQLHHLKDLRHVLQSIKKQAILPNAQDYRAANRDHIESHLSTGLSLVQSLLDENARQSLYQEEIQAKEVARALVMSDMSYVFVNGVRIFQYHKQSSRWYVEVDVTHHEQEQGTATVLCRVSRGTDGQLSATRVDIAEKPLPTVK